MNHKEMTAHIRKRLAKAGVKARCKMRELNGHKMVSIDSPSYGVEFSKEDQSKIVLIVKVNKLTGIRGLPIIDNGTHTFGGQFEFHEAI